MARVLVIDDNADLLQMIRMLLEGRGGHEVILSADGADGIAKALADPPDLAIVDVMMPGMTGYEVCRRLRQESATVGMPIIILTARGQPVDREAALESGADEYMAKPVTMAELLEKVNGLLANQPDRTPGVPSVGTVAFISLRGGVGVTTLGVNAAVTFARRAPDQIALVDFSPSSGHAALQLGLRPEPNWSALAPRAADLDEVSIRNSLLSHAANLSLLAAPFMPAMVERLNRNLTMAVLAALRKNYGSVFVDLPSVLNDGVLAVLESADLIVLVTVADQPSIQTTLGTLQALKAWASKVRLVLNQATPGPIPPLDALQRILKQPFLEVIPYDTAQVQALGQGQPLAFANPQSPMAQRVAGMVAKLAAV